MSLHDTVCRRCMEYVMPSPQASRQIVAVEFRYVVDMPAKRPYLVSKSSRFRRMYDKVELHPRTVYGLVEAHKHGLGTASIQAI